MDNPYRILGISENATDDEIRDAYRELAKKYHPDSFEGDKEYANSKMAEINEAYDLIMKTRRSSNSSASSYADIRRLIQNGRMAEAQELLDGVSVSLRNAEWYFLKGSIFYSRGWFDDAYSHFTKATQLDPSNREYAAALNNLNMRRSGMYPGGYRTVNHTSGASACNLCSNLICCDCLCEMCGGDLIPCC
ncbi:MAG: J domain-containing protein [Oscillospiraceae bacterium]|nr:J domain-containing protein [Oscillospiraceae bacterium]